MIDLGMPIIDFLNQFKKMQRDRDWYFRVQDSCSKAIMEELAKIDSSLVAHPKDYFIPSYRGTGPAISFEDVFLYADSDAKVFCIMFSIHYAHESDSHLPSEDIRDLTQRKIRLNVPLDLLIHFKRDKFNEWLEVQRKERELKQKQADLKILKELVNKYPDWNKE